MLRFIDISDWQNGIDLEHVAASLDAVAVKATQGESYVSECCDYWIQKLKKMGKSWGFYHFADSRTDPRSQASYFIANCSNYFGEGIPILDWEDLYENGELVSSPTIDWVNSFVDQVHKLTNVWPWVYGNPWRFAQGQLNQNCAVWVADYPEVASPRFEDAENWQCPEANGNVVAWQFCSDGKLGGYGGNLDLDLFYGNKEQWAAYAKGDNRIGGAANSSDNNGNAAVVLENDEMKVTVEVKNG